MSLRVVFMGTPDFASASLKALLDADFEVAAVFTQPDKPRDRGMKPAWSPVKELAVERGIDVYQPASMRTQEASETLRTLEPDVLAVVAYGKILPDEVLAIPRLGSVNVHGSLLPKYRGAAPIQWAVLNGDAETGVSIQQMDAGLDTGDVLVCEKVAIGPEETSGELFDRVTAVGARLLCETLPGIEAGALTPAPQDHAAATAAPMLTKEMAEFRWTDTAAHIHNWVRGMNPWPAAWFVTSGGRKVKVLACRVREKTGAPGAVLAVKPLTVACGEGAVELLRVVPEGSKPMDGAAFAAGLRLKTGDTL